MAVSEIITINPATEEICGRYSIMSVDEVQAAIANAARTQENWQELDLSFRLQIL